MRVHRIFGIIRGMRRTDGQATLSFIILISGLILEIAIAGSFVTYFMSSSGLGERLSARALAAASSGVRDAQMRIVRNKEYGAGSSVSYSFPVNQDAASVTISRIFSDPNYVYTITSVGVAGTRQRKVVATMFVNQGTGLIELKSVTEQALQ